MVDSFPAISRRDSFPLDAVTCSGPFASLMEEMHSTELRNLIGDRLGMDLGDKPPVVTLRGRTDTRDGDVHTDSKSKLVTLLLYLNPGWQDSRGRLRLLYDDKDLGRYAAEISPAAGQCVIFKVTPNGWHGHVAFDADSNAGTNGGLLWHTNLGISALSNNHEFGGRYNGGNYTDVVPEMGITGTPVIDPVSGTLYVDVFTREVAATTNYYHRIHALNITNGTEQPYSPVRGSRLGSGPGRGQRGRRGDLQCQTTLSTARDDPGGRNTVRRLWQLCGHRSLPRLGHRFQRHQSAVADQLRLQYHAQCDHQRVWRSTCRRRRALDGRQRTVRGRQHQPVF